MNRRISVKDIAHSIITYILLIILFIFFFFPIYWMVVSSFKPFSVIMSRVQSLVPTDFTLAWYIELFSPGLPGTIRGGFRLFGTYLRNAITVSLITTIITLAIAILAGFALSRFKFKGQLFLSRLMLMFYFYPWILVAIPIYEMFSKISLLDNLLGIVIIHTAIALPFGIWLFKEFIATVPIELEEAAMVDGSSHIQAFLRITLPLLRSGILTVVAYAFITSWGEYLFAQTLVITDMYRTIPPGLANYLAEQYIEWGLMLAGSTMAILPVIIFFLPLSRFFLKGVETGGLRA